MFIKISNHEGEEAASPFIGAPPTHLDQSFRVSGPSFPLLSIPENMESPYVDYKSKKILRGKEVDLGKSTYLLYR